MHDDYFSLTRVRLRQYRSIAAADVELSGLVFLVGPNGAGKSNFLDALRLVSESLRTSLADALDARGGLAEVRRKSTGHPSRFGVELEFRGPGFEGAYGFQVAGARGGGFRVVREECGIRFGGTGKSAGKEPGTAAGFRVDDGQLTSATERGLPAADPRRLLLADAAKLKAFRPVYEGLAGIGVLNLDPQAMRRPAAPDAGRSLQRDGANIAGVLHRMGRSAAGREDKIRVESYLRQMVPGVRGAARRTQGGRETVEFTQDVPGAKNPWRFTAQSVSDGTLRALGVLVGLFSAPGDRYSTVAIEEPETALHPTASGPLLAALRDASLRRQVIATSHSADLLESEDIDPAELRAVRCTDGQTVIGALDDPGMYTLRAQLALPGQLLRTDQLLPRPVSAELEAESR
ncbi:Predicted ATPase [Streptomyces sp. DvalAA-14]|uniref:AAA family ATPase n=1 Tax=unclassified Streptomyces TaxID=2593676 RepID=UPI00081B5532|nr:MULTISPECIES: AAA family ATPase [unclassified Streptomyces]MYS22933.1 AAA family ATPase [Streptomyces sp. SID4948]SCE24764.1 Predicted ATPase [Streptomyces sp. DvalAA-14]